MTPEEAIEFLKKEAFAEECVIEHWRELGIGISINVERKQALDMAIEALEKQKPKAPIMKSYYEDMPNEEYLCCPTCGDILTDRIPYDNKNFYFHCLNCGQRFDWDKKDD